MRKLILFICITILFNSCNETRNSLTVSIETEKDTLLEYETFTARLSVPHLKTTIPSFYIIGNEDIFLLPYDNDDDYAIFQGRSNKLGERKFIGYVEFVDLKGNEKKESFVIKFYIKEKN
jgi:hypothetical protein